MLLASMANSDIKSTYFVVMLCNNIQLELLVYAVSTNKLYSFRVRHSRGEMYILATAVCVSICLFLAAFQHYCTDPDVIWRNVRG